MDRIDLFSGLSYGFLILSACLMSLQTTHSPEDLNEAAESRAAVSSTCGIVDPTGMKKGGLKMIRRSVAMVLFVWVSMAGLGAADSWELDLSAGSTSLSGGIHYKTYLDAGYIRVGGTGTYTDDDDSEYRWISLDMFVGSDTVRPGLFVDLGLRGILGRVKEPLRSGDLGALGFAVAAGYLFSRDVTLIPIEVFSTLTWAPGPLSFRDTESFFQTDLGVGLRIIRNASLFASYTYYRVELESGSTDWSMNDHVIRAGLMLRF
jgi:hypothetical protein